MKAVLLGFPLLLAGCATVPPASEPQVDSVAFEVKSWGALVHDWAVLADGSATSTTRISASNSPWPPYTLEHRRFVLPAAELARLRALAGALPRPAPSDEGCRKRITDAAYGALSLVRGDTTEALPFYEGCFDVGYARYIAQLKAIDALVLEAARAAPVERREEVTEQTD